MRTRRETLFAACALASLAAGGLRAQTQTFGPIDAALPAGGDAYVQPLGVPPAAANAVAAPLLGETWTLSGWIETGAAPKGTMLIGGFGTPASGARRFLALVDGRPTVVADDGLLTARTAFPAGGWHHLAATFDAGHARLFLDGRAIAEGTLHAAPVSPTAVLGPRGEGPAFAGRIAGLRLDLGEASPTAVRLRAQAAPDPALIAFQTGSPSWPVQVRQMYGQKTPQDAWTRPKSLEPFARPVAKPLPDGPVLAPAGADRWTVHGWRLAAAPGVAAGGEAISRPGFDAARWYAATVPGTVLTTLVDRGVYPDPAYGLNNLAIPESLARQDYWYRTEFDAPAFAAGKRPVLLFDGINYAAEIWVNGALAGGIKGAFARGRFDLAGLLVPGRNAVAVRISPPPHPGLAQEESLTSGVGENGGLQMLDGPTFVASEGWDWIPTIRDRNSGLWQSVMLHAIGAAELGDANVVTTLPRADNSVAEIDIAVPVTNRGDRAQTVAVRAAFDDVAVERTVTLAPGATQAVRFRPADFPQLAVRHPRLWWPNGYGEQALHQLTLTTSIEGAVSDTRRLRFGMREVTYDLSLMDGAGALRRVTVDLNRAGGRQVIDGSHEGIRKVAGGWAMSLAPGAEQSAAVTPLQDAPGLSPYLVLRVNGVRIAAKGGNIGMDDFMKRVDRARLEPMFRLHKEANLNIVRNWVGQDTEETFFDLADEYGMMVLSDFWESTQDYNLETDVPELFMANAAEVVKRFRNHPSIVVWFGRNEGVPQPALNLALDRLVREEDGTRLYMGSSNRVNLQNSGPYNWQPPATYFTTHARGFSVEDGTPSLPTLEAWRRAIPPADQWPISDSWAYHDWHQTGNGAVRTFVDALERRFGVGTDLPDFERKAQMMQYESYRAIFEGFNAGLWTVNSGRMLWMTQPAWPSSAWNIFSSDYDTQASFYGVKKASEPVHVQMNLPDGKIVLVNNRLEALRDVRVTVHAVDLAGRVLADRSATLTAPGERVSDVLALDLPALTGQGMALIRLVARDAAGQALSSNFYWQGVNDAAYRGLTALAPATLDVGVTRGSGSGDEAELHVHLANRGTVPAIETKLTLFDGDNRQILPAYFSDNYVSLLPGESDDIVIRLPAAKARDARVALRGWNVTAATAEVR